MSLRSHPSSLTGGSAAKDYIEILSGPEDGKVFELSGPVVTIGRLAGNDVFVPLELSVSRRHARIVRTGDGYDLEILEEARNGGTVLSESVAPGQRAGLRRGDTFTLGDVLFLLGARDGV